MFTIKSVFDNGVEVGFLCTEDEAVYTVSRNAIRSKDIFSTLPGNFTLHHGDRMLKLDGNDIPVIQLSDIPENQRYGIYVEVDESTLLPITETAEGFTTSGEKLMEITQVDLGSLNIKTRDELISFLEEDSIDIDARLYINPNQYVSPEARFSIQEVKEHTQKFLKYVSKFLEVTIPKYKNQLKYLRNAKRIDDESTPDDIMIAYFQDGYPLIAETPVEVKFISGQEYSDYILQDVQYSSIVRDLTFSYQSGTGITWVEGELDKAKDFIDVDSARRTRINTDRGNIQYRSVSMKEKLVLIRYENFNIIIGPVTCQLITRGLIERNLSNWKPMISVSRQVPYELMNILNEDTEKSLDNMILCEQVSKSLVNALKISEGSSSFEILSNAHFSVSSVIKYIFRLDNQAMSDNDGIGETNSETKENLNKRYFKGIEIIRELLQYLEINENGVEFSSDVDDIELDDITDVDDTSNITKDEVKALIEDFVSGRRNIGSTGSTLFRIKNNLKNDLYYFLRVALMYLGMSWEDIMPRLLEIAEGNFNGLLKLEKDGKSVEVELDIDQNVIVNKNIQDYINYTSLQDKNAWLYVLDVFTTPNTFEHMAIRYLNLRVKDAKNKYNQQFSDILVELNSVLEDLINRRQDVEILKQAGRNINIKHEILHKMCADFIFGIYLGNLKVEERTYKYENGNKEMKFATKMNLFGEIIEIEMFALKLEYIQKNITEHIDTLAAICDTSVALTGITKAFVNAKVKWNKVTPKKGYEISEFPIMAMYIPMSVGTNFLKVLRDKGYLTDPKTGRDVTFSLISTPPLFTDVDYAHYSPKDYVNRCHQYIQEHKGKQDKAYRCPATPLQMEFPGVYHYKELDDAPGQVTGATRLSKPRVLTFDEGAKTIDSIKMISSSDSELFFNYIPLECYKVNSFAEVSDFILSNGPVVKRILGGVIYNSKYEDVRSLEDLKAKGMVALKMGDGRYLVRTDTRYMVTELR